MRLRLLGTLLAFGAAVLPSVSRGQQCPMNVPHTTGEWVTLPYQIPINPISATLLHTGQVLIVAGSENDASNNSKGSESYRAAVWDPTGTTQSSITVQNLTYDVFCSGTSALPDGRALIVGGTSDYSFTGENRSSIFDPATSAYVQSQNMANGRWYATTTELGDGRIMAFSGLSSTGGTNNTVEIYDLTNAGAGWGPATTPAPFGPPLYPRQALLPNGKVFYSGHGSGGSNTNGWIFDPVARSWVQSAPTTRDRSYGSAVLLPLLPPTYTPRMMALGGGSPATSSTEIIDLSVASPAWSPGADMSTGRIQMDAVLLPDTSVLALGGSVNNEAADTPGKTADLFRGGGSSRTSAGTASYVRLYHSTALLLPDARVFSIGGNPGGRGSYQPAIEIYSPAYLFDASDQRITSGRPTITGISAAVLGYSAGVTVTYTSAAPIGSAVLVRPGSVTHAFDMEQRLVGLCGPSPQPACSGGGTLNLTTPPNGNVAPPGYYMLFLVDTNGTPSVARFIQLTPYTTTPPRGAITSPASNQIIPAGGSVNFETTTTATKYSWVFPGGSPGTSTAQNPGPVTFATPGTYTASLTIIDAAGNSDPSPPTRTITVTPATPDFDIAVSPSSKLVTPGQSTTFTVTVTSNNGFAGAVSFSVGSESGFPSGITSGGFSPSSIVGPGTTTLTMNTTTATVPYALSLTVTGTSGTISHTGSTTLLVTLAAPASLTASGGDGQATLSWATSTGATGYHLKRATTNGGPYTSIACTTQQPPTPYVDTPLTNGTTYFYVVSAAFTSGPVLGGESADSSQTSVTPQGTVPAAPGGLTATAGNAQIALSWNASTGATGYRVKRSTTSGGPYSVVGSPGATSFTDTTVTNGTPYFYVVSAVNSAGESANSSELSATPSGAPPAPPSGLTLKATKPRRLMLQWVQSTTPGVTQNGVYRRTNPGSYPTAPFAQIPATTSYNDDGLVSRAGYCYRVTAFSGTVESAPSAEACGSPK